MTSFDDRNDDTLPEELASQNQALTRALSRTSQRFEPLTAAEQGESVARVREHLLLAHRPARQNVSEQQTGTANSTPLNPIMPPPFKPQRHIVRLINGLVAMLVIGAIIGASVLLFTHHTSSITAIPQLPAGSSATSGLTVVASSTADGLTMSLAITPSPYFLSEMLTVKVTLTNHSQKNAYPGGLPFSGDPCGYYPGVEIAYTGNPQFPIPIAFDHSCPPIPPRPATLKPGQTMSFLGYIPLQQSGQLTLTSPANFYTGPASQNNFPAPTSILDPFGSQGLVARISVSPTLPADRRIPFKVQGDSVIVKAPLSARGPLLYAYSIGCQDDNNDGGSTGSGNFSWDTLTNATVHRPGCPGKNLQWSFAFAIPGYAVAVGRDNDPIKS